MLETTDKNSAVAAAVTAKTGSPEMTSTPAPPASAPRAEDDGKYMRLNLGPSHPATHGTLRIFVELEGEVIRNTKLEIGYLHRCFEKMAETHPWNQVIPFTDRLNYVSAMMNNVGYVMAVEKALGVEVTPRCQRIRLIMCELSRIIDHLVCIG